MMTDKLDDLADCALAEAIECTVDAKLLNDWRDGREFLLSSFLDLSVINAGVDGNPPLSGERRKEHEHLNALAAAAKAALPELRKQFVNPLETGKFTSTGMFSGGLAERKSIDRDLWSQLDPFSQYEASIVCGHGNLRIYGVRVSRAVVMQAAQPATAASEGTPSGLTPGETAIHTAITALWLGTVPVGLSAQKRDEKIMAYLKDKKDLSDYGPSTIKRYFRKTKKRGPKRPKLALVGP